MNARRARGAGRRVDAAAAVPGDARAVRRDGEAVQVHRSKSRKIVVDSA